VNRRGIRTPIGPPSRCLCKMARGHSLPPVHRRVRRIEPHALGYDGFRWHARARDAEDGAFKDHVLGRLSGASLQGPAEAPSSTDQDWHGWVTLTIAPNPGLSPAQKKVIERDYGMRGRTADLKVRKALAYYTKHRPGLDRDPKAPRP